MQKLADLSHTECQVICGGKSNQFISKIAGVGFQVVGAGVGLSGIVCGMTPSEFFGCKSKVCNYLRWFGLITGISGAALYAIGDKLLENK